MLFAHDTSFAVLCSPTTISFAEVLDAEEEERMSLLDLDGRGGGGSNDMSASLMGGAEEEEVTISKPSLDDTLHWEEFKEVLSFLD